MTNATETMTQAKPLLYGVGSIADYLGIRERQARHQIEKGHVPSFKIGGTICARPADLDAWLERCAAEAAGAGDDLDA